MKNTIQPAIIYQLNHKAGLSLCGFNEDSEPQWLGNDKQHQEARELLNNYYN